MLKKTIILFVLLLIGVSVKASELVIDSNIYNTDSDIIEKGFKYYYVNNILELSNYNGSIIKGETLNLLIRGENSIIVHGNNSGIDGKWITIDGGGTLSIESETYGINGNNISINNVTLKGKTTKAYIKSGPLDIKNTSFKVEVLEDYYVLASDVTLNKCNFVNELIGIKNDLQVVDYRLEKNNYLQVKEERSIKIKEGILGIMITLVILIFTTFFYRKKRG